MDGQAIMTISASVVALAQLVKWSGLPDRLGPLAVLSLSAILTVLWGLSRGEFLMMQLFDYIAGWIAIATSAAGVFGFIRSTPETMTAIKSGVQKP